MVAKAEQDNLSKEINISNSRDNCLNKQWNNFIIVIAISMSIFQIVFVYFITISPWVLYNLHIAFASTLTLLLYNAHPNPVRKKIERIPIYDLIIIILIIISTIYMIIVEEEIIYRIGICPTNLDLIFSFIIILVTLEITRRTVGLILPTIAVIFILYAHFGYIIPGLLGHKGYSWRRIISYATGLDGIFSIPIAVSATFVFLFILFAAFLKISGAGQFFIDIALSVAGTVRGGPAKVAVVASAFFGTISGNSPANVTSTGAFTIPLMKSIGYKPALAGAVEAVASTGGQIMPPILGAAAFIMATLIGTAYVRIVVASLIPAFLYFLSVFIMIDFESIKVNLKGIPREEIKPFKQVISKNFYLIIPVFVLIYFLVFVKTSPIKAAVYAIFSVFFSSLLSKTNRMGIEKLVQALTEGAKNSLGIIAACATAGLVIGMLNLTGTGLKFTAAVLSFAQGNLLIALILTMIASIILGMGLPTTAAYLICAAVVVPTLRKLGVDILAAHMFVFYFACLSAITPPVALAAYAAAGISGAKPLEVAILSCKLGITAYIIPYFFITNKYLLGGGSIYNILLTLATGTIAIICFSAAVQGIFFKHKLLVLIRILLGISALLLLMADMRSDLIGIFIITIAILINNFILSKREERQK